MRDKLFFGGLTECAPLKQNKILEWIKKDWMQDSKGFVRQKADGFSAKIEKGDKCDFGQFHVFKTHEEWLHYKAEHDLQQPIVSVTQGNIVLEEYPASESRLFKCVRPM